MVGRIQFLLGMLFALLMIGCAGFAYRYYGMSGVFYQNGVLLGPKPSDDLPFERCAPTATSRNPCVVMFANEFFSLKTDYETTKRRLSECESARRGD